MPLHDAREVFERDYIRKVLASHARQHLAHGGRPRRRTQQALPEDARLGMAPIRRVEEEEVAD